MVSESAWLIFCSADPELVRVCVDMVPVQIPELLDCGPDGVWKGFCSVWNPVAFITGGCCCWDGGGQAWATVVEERRFGSREEWRISTGMD